MISEIDGMSGSEVKAPEAFRRLNDSTSDGWDVLAGRKSGGFGA